MLGRLAVIGAGSWGTALARLLALNHHAVSIHCWPAEIAQGINTLRRNPLYFADIELPSSITATTEIYSALNLTDTAFLVIPTIYLRKFMADSIDTWRDWAAGRLGGSPDRPRLICNCTKGLMLEPTQRTDAWLAELLPEAQLVHLAGPNFAIEIIAGLPAAAVAAGPEAAAQRVQKQLMCDNYRVYTGGDPVGVEVAGFYKNIIAIAAGAVSELGLGENARATLITRALAEMGRLVAYFGGEPATLYGLAGIGDLLLTCGSAKSRNFQVGQRRARGQGLAEILAEMTQVAEGVAACRAVHLWPAEHVESGAGILPVSGPGSPDSAATQSAAPTTTGEWPELPIAAEVYRFVHENVDPRDCIARLMRRPPRPE